MKKKQFVCEIVNENLKICQPDFCVAVTDSAIN